MTITYEILIQKRHVDITNENKEDYCCIKIPLEGDPGLIAAGRTICFHPHARLYLNNKGEWIFYKEVFGGLISLPDNFFLSGEKILGFLTAKERTNLVLRELV